MDIETNTYAGPVRIEASNLIALLYFVFCNTLTLFGLYLSTQASTVLWISGQITLALAFMQWFIILHEAGHGTFFKSKHLNTLTGHYASVFAFIPFLTWRSVHNSHHKWTGWQDIDLTTASLVPRELSRAERFLFNNCWRFCIPIFSVIYRITNFWNLVRVRQFLSKQYKRSFVVNSIFLALIYIFIFSYFNFPVLFETLGLALFISLFLQENIIVSQHTHIPMRHSGNQSQRPFSCKQQVVFTRSLRFPRWISQILLLNFNAHELHHCYLHVPGYFLQRINFTSKNEFNGFRWIVKARTTPGEIFFLQNRDFSGLFL